MEKAVTVDIWNKAIELAVDGGDHFKSVQSSREALEALKISWPRKGGPAYAAAKRACLDALGGKGTSADAAKAFEEAAREAGIARE